MLEVGLEQVGPYANIRLLGAGSTGSTYLGKHTQRKKYVILKVLRTPLITPAAQEAFLARVKQLKKLKHRNIAEIQDFGLIPDTTRQAEYGYLVMQYVLGDTMPQRFAAGQCSRPDEVKRVLSPIADALHYAHVMNIVHGNLHPGNLLIGENKDIILTDFSPMLQPYIQLQDQANALPYMAPEHLRGTPVATSDQYALAVIVYTWLCGRRPYEATEHEQLLYQQEHEPIPSPSSLNSDISPTLEHVLLRALSPDPGDRFSHTQTFADAYLRVLMGFPMDERWEKKNVPVRQIDPVLPTPVPSTIVKDNEREIVDGNVNGQGKGAINRAPTEGQNDVGAQFIAPSSLIHISSTSTDNQETTNEEPIDEGAMNHAPTANHDEMVDEHTPDKGGKRSRTRPVSHNGLTRLQDIVTADLCQGGILSSSLTGYEERAAQVEMATLVAHSIIEDTPSIIEAATGTGKSLAYLIPIVRSGRVAIISTANKALQEQLFYKDIPFVQKHIKHFEAALVKGMGNYVCLDRLETEHHGIQHYIKNRDFMRLVDIINDPGADFNGDFETLDFPLPGDIRGKVNADRDQCTWSKCGYFGDCYVRKMKVKAGHARVIVVNHTLLLLDAAMEGYLLPERDVIIVDEAHHLEEEATRAFTITVSQAQVSTLLAQHMLKNHSSLALQEETKQTMVTTWERLFQVADPGFKGKANLPGPLEEGLGLATVISKLADSLRQQRPQNMPEKDDELYDKLISRAENLAENIRIVFSVGHPDKFVYYVERVNASGRRGGQLEVSAAPLDVTEWLKKQLFSKCNVICTSATLATIGPNPVRPDERGPNFAYFRRRVGLDYVDYPNVQERILPLTFDYENNALLYVPRHVPEPAYGTGQAAIDYIKAIAHEMVGLVEASRGRAFLLFSSKRMLEEVYDEFCNLLPRERDYTLLRQGDMTRMELMRSFREREGAVLFGLKSFWEGVDIAGEALSMVVIDKLPFDPPDDPVHEARVAQMKAAGENWFGIYVLPQAVLRLKQGLGRLLRTREDRGVMAILDTRLHTKGYGKQVVNALPPARRTTSLRDVERFFAQEH